MGSKLRNTVRSKNNVQGASTKSRQGAVPVMNLDHTPVECALYDLERLTEPSLDESPADEARSNMVEGGEDIGAPFIADGDAAEPGKPSECPLDHPSVSAKALTALDATPGDAWNDPPPAQRPPEIHKNHVWIDETPFPHQT